MRWRRVTRSYSQVTTAIWRNEEFLDLPKPCQWTYFMLITQPEITSAGTLPLTLRRWSRFTTERPFDSQSIANRSPIEELSIDLAELEERDFVVIDHECEELLARSFVKWDGGYKNPKRVESVRAAANAVTSPKLRAHLAVELDKLGVTHEITERPLDSQPIANRGPIEGPRAPEPQPTTHNPQPLDSSSPGPRKRGARLPENWKPTEADIAWQRNERITDTAARRETSKFRDHFAAASGTTSVKLDWSAAWRNWIRRAVDQGVPGQLRSVAAPVDNSWMDTMPPELGTSGLGA